MALVNRPTGESPVRFHDEAEVYWPLADWRRSSSTFLVQQGAVSNCRRKRIASRLLPIMFQGGSLDTSALSLPASLHSLPAAPAEVVSETSVPLQVRFEVRPMASRILREPSGERQGVRSWLSRLLLQRQMARRSRPMNFQECHGKEVAVSAEVLGQARLLRGKATYLVDPTLGRCLSVEINDPDAPGLELLIREDQWTGHISPGDAHGCFAIIHLESKCSPF